MHKQGIAGYASRVVLCCVMGRWTGLELLRRKLCFMGVSLQVVAQDSGYIHNLHTRTHTSYTHTFTNTRTHVCRMLCHNTPIPTHPRAHTHTSCTHAISYTNAYKLPMHTTYTHTRAHALISHTPAAHSHSEVCIMQGLTPRKRSTPHYHH